MKLRNVLLFLFALLIIPAVSHAQRWKRKRYEVSFGLGASNFLGDLGGANQIGTHYFRDLNWVETDFVAAMGLRYKLTDHFALNTHLTYGNVSGSDAQTTDPFRSFRNLSFHSVIWEYNVNLEYAYPREEIGHLYRLRRVRGKRAFEIYTYGFAGLGVFHFNPEAELNNTTYDLHDYHTEGEGFPGGPKNYSLWGVCIPVGVGFKYIIDQDWGVGLEIGFRKTFTDYIDDVSGTYWGTQQDFINQLGYDKGVIAYQLANRSKPPFLYEPGVNPTLPGDQRGQAKYTDSYMFAVFSVSVKIRNGANMLPRF